jgi:hypothetical protein
MSLNKASLWLGTLVVLAGCPGREELSEVTASCNPPSLEVGQTSECTASSKPFTASKFNWSSTNQDVATVDPTGKVTAARGGMTTIIASATEDEITKEARVTLTVTTVHANAITGNETWRAAENPHLVRGSLEVTGTLTLEEGVELGFEQDAELRVTTGALKAMGTAGAPIRMVARQSAPTKGSWRGVVLAAAGSASELNHVTMSHCGAASGKGACLALENQAVPALRHVTVRDSGTAGVVVADDGSAFGTGSTTLTVSGSTGYAVRIGANQAGTLPANSTFTGNTLQAIELRGSVSRSQTWANPGAPYVINGQVAVGSATSPTLTIAAGTVFRFGPEGTLDIGAYDLEGGLIVDGTATAPVLFTADSATPQPGHWQGVVLATRTSSNTRISHATIEYGGRTESDPVANLILTGPNVRAVVDNVLVRKGLSYGVSLERRAAFGPGSTKLSAHDNGGYAILASANEVGSIPTGGTFQGNGNNAVELIPGVSVGTTQTWPNLGIPYVINDFVNVGSPTTATLTLPEGTELRFGPNGGLSVGVTSGSPGILKALGTSSTKIRFVPDTPTPTRGFWRGLHFWNASQTVLNHVIITHAGKGGFSPNIGTGNLNVYKEIGTIAVNSTFSDSSGCGVTRSNGTRTGTENVTTDHTTSNTVSNNTGGDQCTN